MAALVPSCPTAMVRRRLSRSRVARERHPLHEISPTATSTARCPSEIVSFVTASVDIDTSVPSSTRRSHRRRTLGHAGVAPGKQHAAMRGARVAGSKAAMRHLREPVVAVVVVLVVISRRRRGRAGPHRIRIHLGGFAAATSHQRGRCRKTEERFSSIHGPEVSRP